MNRFAKGFRVFSGIFVLLNLVAVFMPLTVSTQENYSPDSWSAFDYIVKMFGKTIPYSGSEPLKITSLQLVWIIGLLIVPAIVSVVTCIWGIVGSPRQIFSSILAFVVTGIYGVMIANIPCLWPEEPGSWVYSRGIASILHLVFCAAACITAVAALIMTPRKEKPRAKEIPQVNEIKQEQIQAKYNLILDEKPQETQPQMQTQPQIQPQAQSPQIPEYTKGQPKGIIRGLTGMYAGAEIPLANGEYIKLGRFTDNDLVFEGQPKVSRNHCRIKWNSNNGKFSFIDYSSNGTFVNGSEDCLPQNLEIEMPPGTIFALGDENNAFRLE